MCAVADASKASPCRCATLTALGCTRAAGFVPAEATAPPTRSRHRAAASWERAELWVHTNTTRPAAVALRPGPHDETGVLKHFDVVCHQIGRHVEVLTDLAG